MTEDNNDLFFNDNTHDICNISIALYPPALAQSALHYNKKNNNNKNYITVKSNKM